jgi:hypothetical protein
LSSTATSLPPNPRSCATDCSMLPSASPARLGEPGLRVAEHWPWATDLVTAFDRLTELPDRSDGPDNSPRRASPGETRPPGGATIMPRSQPANRRRSTDVHRF